MLLNTVRFEVYTVHEHFLKLFLWNKRIFDFAFINDCSFKNSSQSN